MNIHAQTAFLASLVTLWLGVGVLLRSGDRKLAILFALFSANLALWHISDFLMALTGNLFFIRFRALAVCALPLSSYHFFQRFLAGSTLGSVATSTQEEEQKDESLSLSLWSMQSILRWKPYFNSIFFLGALAGIVAALSPLLGSIVVRTFVTVWVFFSLVCVIWLVHLHGRSTPSRIERGRLSYLVIGGLAATSFAAIGLIPGISPIIPSIGKLVVVLYLYLLSQVILRHRLLDLNELLAKVVALLALAMLLGSIFTAIAFWAKGDPSLIVFNVLLVSFALMALFEPIRSRFEQHVQNFVFAERVLLTRVLNTLRQEIPGIIDPELCANRVLDRIYETGRTTHASIYILDRQGAGFTRYNYRGPEPPPRLESSTVKEVHNYLESGPGAILRDSIERQLIQKDWATPGSQGDDGQSREPEDLIRLRALHTCLEKLYSGVLIPLLSDGRTIGFFSLYDERVYEAFSTSEIVGLIEIADLISTLLENSKLYEEMKERDRLAALGEMAAGLAHEIRNPLGAIKAAAQYLEPDSIPEDTGQFLEIIIEEVDRLNGVVTQFLDYARPLKVNLVPTDLGEIVHRTVRLLEQKDIGVDIEVELDLLEDLPKIPADPEQIRQVLINLILNAVQAMQGKGKLSIRTGTGEPDDRSISIPAAFISVEDSGPGIPLEIRDNLFIPFFTTKEQGTGLGLPMCQRIAESHRGRIEIRDRESKGSEFRLWIPLAG